jgi:hypothetical protein
MSRSAVTPIPLERILGRVIVLRGQRVLLDRDLAKLFGVTTKRLNEQVQRNLRRFPEDFMFQLTAEEKDEVVAKCDHLKTLKFSSALPRAFTEHGAIQAANVLNSDAAVEMGIHVVRASVQLRQMVTNHKALASKLAALDARVSQHDDHLRAIIEALRRLTTPDVPTHGRKMGFHQGNR